MKESILKPDISKAISKLTLTVTAHKFGKDDKNLYVETKWLVEGEQCITINDMINTFDSGKNQIVNHELKTDQN